ncbi:Mth938-like domain-containing protein [Mariprofundus ferrooxydans]
MSSAFFKGDISPELEREALLFTGYDNDCIRVNQQPYNSSLCIHAGRLTAPWGPERLRDITVESLEIFMDKEPEILIIGTGRTTAFPEPDALQRLSERHIGFECMDSRSAARTYNILLAEGRNVSAAMLLPGSR